MSAFTSCYCDLIYKNQVAKKIVEKCSFCKPMNKPSWEFDLISYFLGAMVLLIGLWIASKL